MIIDHEDKLKQWIIEDITPLCDAEPDALAKYVVALLKKDIDSSALKNFCIDQLDVFLQNQTVDFVNRLFQKLSDKSYIGDKAKKEKAEDERERSRSTRTSSKSSERTRGVSDNGDAATETRTDEERSAPTRKSTRSGSETETVSKRTSEDSRKSLSTKERSERLEAKEKPDTAVGRLQRRRISPPPSAVGSVKEEPSKGLPVRGRSPRERKRIEPPSPARPSRSGRYERERRKSRSRSRSPYERFERRKEDRENRDIEKRIRCRDFDERGYCMRGDKCPYDHGPDPVVVEDSALEKMVQMKSSMPSMNMAVTAYSALNPPPPGVDNIYSSSSLGNVSEGYNPEAPALTVPASVANIDFSVPPPPLPQRLPYANTPGTVTIASNAPPASAYDPAMVQQVPVSNQPHFVSQRGMYPRRRGGGRFGGEHRPPATSKSLQVKKVPLELNNIASLNEHFSKFGTVTNIQLQFDGAPDSALVTFSTRQEASSAFKSTEPILNNRFIKVFWHKTAPATTTAAAGTTAEQKPTVKHEPPAGTVPVVTKHRGAFSKAYVPETKLESGTIDGEEPVNPIGLLKKPDGAPMNPVAVARVNRNKRMDREKKLRLLDVHRRKTELYKKQMEQQKLLLEKIQKAENSETKKKLYTLFKTLDSSSTTLKKELEDLWDEIKKLSETVQPANGSPAKKRKRTDTDELDDDQVPRKIQQNRKSDGEFEQYMRVLHVLGCDPTYQDDLIVHMEKFGDLFDMEFLPPTKGRKAIFHYKNIEDAQKAFTEATKFEKCPITVEWSPASKVDSKIVPDEQRKPTEQMTPAALLASLGDDDESDRSDHEQETELEQAESTEQSDEHQPEKQDIDESKADLLDYLE